MHLSSQLLPMRFFYLSVRFSKLLKFDFNSDILHENALDNITDNG
jgi:hypothetical protein